MMSGALERFFAGFGCGAGYGASGGGGKASARCGCGAVGWVCAAGCGWGVCCSSAAPHSVQNFAPCSTSLPQ